MTKGHPSFFSWCLPVRAVVRSTAFGLFAFLTACLLIFWRTPLYAQEPVEPYVADQLVLDLSLLSEEDRDALFTQYNLTHLDSIPEWGMYLVQTPPGQAPTLKDTLSTVVGVTIVELNYIRTLYDDFPQDFYFPYQWGLHNTAQTACGQQGTLDADVDAPEAWSWSTGSNSVLVAVLDAGIQVDHPDLMGKIAGSVNFVSPTFRDIILPRGHGTQVAGIIAAATDNFFLTGSSLTPVKNYLGVAGSDWHAKLLNVKVCVDTGSCYDWYTAKGIQWAIEAGAKVINMSFGGRAPSDFMNYALKVADERGVTAVAAAGNDHSNVRTYPCSSGKTICVGGTDNRDGLYINSNWGTWVHVVAPAFCIATTITNNDYTSLDYADSGTSLAAPFVSGLASLIIARYPSVLQCPWYYLGCTDDAVRNIIFYMGVDPIPGTGTYWWKGRVNFWKALRGY